MPLRGSQKYTGKEVSIHVINNAQNGFCPEDCHYCAQAKSSDAAIQEYPLKPDAEILAEARNAYENGAFRYCMVFAGRGPSQRRVEHLALLIREIKAQYPIEVCVSAGLLDREKAQIRKDAGLDRLNHNLNTSERYYPQICRTHTYQDRLDTLTAARAVGMEVSGVIIGMGETGHDIIDVADLASSESPVIPINLLVSIDGTACQKSVVNAGILPRVLCLYRFLNPDAEIRVAAGQESSSRPQVMALYRGTPFSWMVIEYGRFLAGPNVQMIKDAGFTIKSEQNLEKLLGQAHRPSGHKKIDGASVS